MAVIDLPRRPGIQSNGAELFIEPAVVWWVDFRQATYTPAVFSREFAADAPAGAQRVGNRAGNRCVDSGHQAFLSK